MKWCASFVAVLLWPGQNARTVDQLLDQGRFDAALEELNRQPSNTVSWHLLASRAWEGKQVPAKAVAEAEAALALEPLSEPAHLRLGQIFLSHNTPAAAYEIFNDALGTLPQSFLLRLGRGLALKELQRHDEAIADFRACLQKIPGSGIAFDGLATSLLHSAKYEELLREANAFMDRNRGDFRGPYFAAAARDGLLLPDSETLRLLDGSIGLNGQFAASYALRGKILLRTKQPLEAALALERAVALRPDHVPSHMSLARVYRQLGRDVEARREFEIVRKLNAKGQQTKPSLLYHRGGQ